MIDLVEATEGALALGFVAVTLLVLRARAKRHLPAFGWLAAAFASLALGVAFGRRLTAPVEAMPVLEAVLRGGRAGAFFPGYFLLRFLHEIELVPRWLRRVTLAGAAVPAAAVVTGVASPARTFGVSGWEVALSVSFALTCVGAHAWVARRFWVAAARVDTSVLRRRLRTMALSALLTGSLVLLAFVASPVAALVSRVAAFSGVVLLWFAVQPPALLRLAARYRDAERVRAMRQELLRATDPVGLAEHLVRSVSALTGAEGAWLHHAGEVTARHRVAPEQAHAYDVAVRSAAGTGFTSRVLVRVPSSSGWIAAVPVDSGWLAVRTTSYTPVFGTDELAMLDAVADDLSLALGRTRVQAREREALRRLEQAARLKDDFLSTMSHELRTPLTAIRGFSELLLADGTRVEPGMHAELMNRIVSNAADLERLLTGLLQLSTLRDGSRRGSDRVHRLDRVVDVAIDRTAEACARHDVRVEVEPVSVTIDAESVADATEQLIHNAVKFSPARSPIHLRGWIRDGEAVVEVEDHGIGMSDVEREKLFEPFSRAGDVLTRDTRGAGVGLAIVAEIVTLLDARVEVESRPNEGSTFRLKFPACPRTEPPALEPAADRPERPERPHISVVA